jgi:chitin disaccharide deacetylase
MHKPRTNELLGYPADARLLILNADDFGMYQAINEGTLQTLTEGVVRSTTLMTPCPWAGHAMKLLNEHPDIAFGVHLTAICDIPNYTYGPLTPKEQVPSLIDEHGTFYNIERIPEFLAQAKLHELEAEWRAQIGAVLSVGLTPTHVDWHCLHNGGRADIFDMTVGLAKEYGLAVRVAQQPLNETIQSQGLPTADYELVDSFAIDTAGKSARYAQMLRELPEGLSEWAVHPSLGGVELQDFDDGWHVRRADFDFLMSPEAREIIQQEGIMVLNYVPLQEVWRSR